MLLWLCCLAAGMVVIRVVMRAFVPLPAAVMYEVRCRNAATVCTVEAYSVDVYATHFRFRDRLGRDVAVIPVGDVSRVSVPERGQVIAFAPSWADGRCDALLEDINRQRARHDLHAVTRHSA